MPEAPQYKEDMILMYWCSRCVLFWGEMLVKKTEQGTKAAEIACKFFEHNEKKHNGQGSLTIRAKRDETEDLDHWFKTEGKTDKLNLGC